MNQNQDQDPMENWREKMEQYVNDPHLIEMLRHGPKSSTQAMAIMGMKKRYKRIMGIED